tara:strand:- start:14829 stop:15839 length:1011 start_codon:yes stop_codon:yes gene_type:complete
MFKIDNLIIGKLRTFIIAEIGINHLGSLHNCKKLINQAKKSGADAVKLQISDPEYSYNKDTVSYKIFKKNRLSFEKLKKIKSYARKKKIILFATPGDFKSLEIIKRLNFPAIKISSGLMTNEALVSEIAKIKKPVIFSTGMAYMSEIKKIISILKRNKNKYFAILKCTSLYPCPPNFVNLISINNLKNKFPKIPIGFSDHTKSIDACIAAVALGAKIIEKHITLNKNFKVPDQKVSCDPKEFKLMVKKIRYIEQTIGKENIFPTKEEIKKRNLYHRSIITVKKISIGEKFDKNNIALKRSTGKKKGLHPKYFFKILGKKSKKNININTNLLKKHTL